MLQCKTFELRDEGTFIPVAAVLVTPLDEYQCALTVLPGHEHEQNLADRYLLRRCGYPLLETNVLLSRLDGTGIVKCCPAEWTGRTFPVAHQYILEHWDELTSGAVIDVQFILGETATPKRSERLPVQA